MGQTLVKDNLYDLDMVEILESKDEWKQALKSTYGRIKEMIGDKDCFDTIVRVKLKDCIVDMPIATIAINLMMWRPMIKFTMLPTEQTIFDCSNIRKSTIKNYFDNVYVRPLKSKVNIVDLNLELITSIEYLKRIVEDFGLVLGITYNYYQLIQLSKRNPRFGELINSSIPSGLQPKEIETYCKELLNEIVEILSNSNTGFAPLLNSGAGINVIQLQELLALIGNKPDLEGNTYPVPINTNIMIKGLDTPTHYMLDASGGRKALILNKKNVGNSGYFSRKLNLLNLDTTLDKNEKSDCHTNHYLKYYIMDKESLLRLEGRYYKSNKNEKLKCISILDKHLIGHTIYLRSPIFCKGDKICRKCYGELYNINKAMNIGLLAATIISSRFTQNILSAKHTLLANSEELQFTTGYEDYFILDGTQLMLDYNNINNNNELFLTIPISSLDVDVNEDIENSEDAAKFEEEITVDTLMITNSDGEIVFELRELNDIRLFISPYLKDAIDRKSKKRNGKLNIPLIALSDVGEALGIFSVANNELTKTLNQVNKLIENEEHAGCDNITDMVALFNKLLIDGKIYAHLVHAEIICRNLMRDTKDITARPNLNTDNPQYQILTVKRAIMKNPSPFISISFEKVQEQFRNVSTYKKRKSSVLDKLFIARIEEYYKG